MQAIAQGAFDFIAKPFDIEEMVKLVRRATEPSEPKNEPADENHLHLRRRLISMNNETDKIQNFAL